MSDAKHEKKTSLSTSILSGLTTGVLCSAVFHPWDRALYLSAIHKRAFLDKRNFKAAYQGVIQTVFQRSAIGSVYYILQAQMNAEVAPYLREQLQLSEAIVQFSIGSAVGSLSAIVTTPIAAVKYQVWSNSDSFMSTVKNMRTKGGVRPFTKGVSATIARDVVFGSTYESIRYLMQKNLPPMPSMKKSSSDFLFNSTAAGLATIISGPLNYARNMQFSSAPNERTLPIRSIINEVRQESEQHRQSCFSRLSFFQQRFRVGWGTARIAVGIGVGQAVFDALSKAINGMNNN